MASVWYLLRCSQISVTAVAAARCLPVVLSQIITINTVLFFYIYKYFVFYLFHQRPSNRQISFLSAKPLSAHSQKREEKKTKRKFTDLHATSSLHLLILFFFPFFFLVWILRFVYFSLLAVNFGIELHTQTLICILGRRHCHGNDRQQPANRINKQ